jgi:tetratricopeptide (TPR) repeat protein
LDEDRTPEEIDEQEEQLSSDETSRLPEAWRGRSREKEMSPELSAEYDAVLDRVEEFARRAALLPKRELKRFRRALWLLQSGKGVEALAKDGDMLVKGLGVYEALLARSWTVRYDDPREMCHLARAAVEVAEHLDVKVHGSPGVKDYQARAWGELANAYRVTDRLVEAEQAFGTAFSLAREGSGDARLQIRLLTLEASLLGMQREFGLALPRLDTVSELHREAGDLHQAGCALVKKALYTFTAGKPLEALNINTRALGMIDEEREPPLAAVAVKNQILFLIECGRYRDARKMLFQSRARFASMGRIVRLRLRNLEGRIAYGVRQYESAAVAFRDAKAGFEEAGMGLHCALEGLQLAMTLMRQGQVDEAIQETLQSASVFAALSIHHEVLGVVMFLERAFKAQRGSLMLLENTVAYLRRRTNELGLV